MKWLQIMFPVLLAFSFLLASKGVDAQTLAYESSWLGNTFDGTNFTTSGGWTAGQHVQINVADMFVGSSGTVFTDSGWDEGGFEAGIYQNGQPLGCCYDVTHGWGRGGGNAVTASTGYIYVAMTQNGDDGAHTNNNQNGLRCYPNPGTIWYCVKRLNLNGSPAAFAAGYGVDGDMMIVDQTTQKNSSGNYVDESVTGLAVDSSYLYVADNYDGQIHKYTLSSLNGSPTLSWNVTSPGTMTLDGSGRLWILTSQGTPIVVPSTSPKVLSYSTTGTLLSGQISFRSTQNPTSINWDSSAGRLLVADAGSDQNIKLYNPSSLSGSPTTPASTFGAVGGIFSGSGATIGTFRPLAFYMPTGVGADSSGNIYVADQTYSGGCLIESYTSGGSLNWSLQGAEFLSRSDLDSTTQADAYSRNEHYTLNWSNSTPGTEWSLAGMTLNKLKYPDDPRFHAVFNGAAGPLANPGWTQDGTWVRTINGHKFLFMLDQTGGCVGIYRFDPATDGETAIPYGLIERVHGSYNQDSTGWPENEPGTGEWIWIDSNLNGTFESGEYASTGQDSPSANDVGYWVDSNGDIWEAGNYDHADPNGGGIRHFRVQIGSNGYPYWNYANSTTSPPPAIPNDTWISPCYIQYDPASDTMYLGAETHNYPNSDFGGALFYRYDNWSTSPQIHTGYPIAFPSTNGTAYIKSWCVSGSYLFALENYSSEKIDIYNIANGSSAGAITPGSSVGSLGWPDIIAPLSVLQRSNGEYDIFQEEDEDEKNLLYRWNPNPVTVGGTFLLGIDLDGGAVTIEGNNWESYSTALANGLSVSGAGTWSGTYGFTITPTPDANTLSMLESVLYGTSNTDGQGFTLSQPVANGTYSVYLWMIENNVSNSRDADVTLQGVEIATAIGSLPLGAWQKYGPYSASVTNGILSIAVLRHSMGNPLCAGIALYH